MTDDDVTTGAPSLPGDSDNYPVLCPECERHVTDPYGHRRDCPNWGETKSAWLS